MARHTAAITADQNRLAEQLNQGHAALAKRIEELTMMLKMKQAQADLAKVTPIKGGTFEDQLSRILHSIGVALGEEYIDTRNTVGRLPRCKRGDGVLSTADGAVRVVIEATDSQTPRNWTEYFDEAERNRDAAASLGIVRHASQNAGKTVRVLGSRRIVMAFDPESEDPELLRTVVLLLRAAALTAVSRTGEAEIGTAEERIVQAIDELTRLDAIKKMSGTIQKSATSIDRECIKIGNAVRRLLDEAMSALDGARAPERLPRLAARGEPHEPVGRSAFLAAVLWRKPSCRGLGCRNIHALACGRVRWASYWTLTSASNLRDQPIERTGIGCSRLRSS